MQAIETIEPLGAAIAERLPAIAKRADHVEAARRLPADIAEDLASVGAFDMLKPKSLGGLEMELLDVVAVLHALAKAEASVSWCVMIGITSTLNAAYMPHDVAKEVFGKSGTISGGVFAPMGRADDMGDHYRVTGRWQWGSGNANCTWLSGGAMIFKDDEMQRMESGAPYHRMMLFPADQVERIDNWHVMGMRGTGSSDIAVKDVIVPKARSVSLIVDEPVEKGALYLFPIFGLLAAGVAAVALGNAAGALDEIKAIAKAKKNPATGKTMAERQVIQGEIARAEAKLCGAEAFFREVIANSWEAAKTTGDLSAKQRAQIRLAGAYATETAADVTKTAYTLGGGAAVYETSNLQRRFRDAHVATQHIATAPAVYELAGRVGLDLPTDMAML